MLYLLGKSLLDSLKQRSTQKMLQVLWLNLRLMLKVLKKNIVIMLFLNGMDIRYHFYLLLMVEST